MDQSRMVKSGNDLVSALDDRGVPISAALWVNSDDDGSWKLWIAPRNSIRKRDFYGQVVDVIAHDRHRFEELEAGNTEVVSIDHPVLQNLRKFKDMPQTGPIRITNNMIGGYYMKDGILLLMRGN